MSMFDKSNRFYRQTPEDELSEQMPDAMAPQPMAPPPGMADPIGPAPVAKPGFFDFDPERLKADSDEVARTKRTLAIMGGMGDTLSSGQSFGNFYLKQMNPKATGASDMAKSLSDGMEDPTARQAKLYAAYKNAVEGKQLKEQEERSLRLQDPNSKETKALKAMLASNPKWGVSPTDEMTGQDIMHMIDPKRMMETQASANVDFDKKRELQRLDNQDKRLMHLDEIKAKAAEARALKEANNNPNKQAFDRLPKEAQDEVNELAKKNAGKRSIANQLKANLTTLDDAKLSDEQKLTAARGIIKVLNSSEGQDAVGAEEAKRLAGFLEYRFGNMTEPGPFVGRAPINEFQQQIQSKADELGEAVGLNDRRIDELYGRRSPQQPAGRSYYSKAKTEPNPLAEAFSPSTANARSQVPMFTSKDLSGMSDAELEAIHKKTVRRQ